MQLSISSADITPNGSDSTGHHIPIETKEIINFPSKIEIESKEITIKITTNPKEFTMSNIISDPSEQPPTINKISLMPKPADASHTRSKSMCKGWRKVRNSMKAIEGFLKIECKKLDPVFC
jgi:hypothetical protein